MTQHRRWQHHRPSCVLHATASPRSRERRPSTGGGSSTARLASSTSRRAPDLVSNDPSWVVAVPPPVSRPPHHSEPRSRKQRRSTGGGSSTARLASSMSRRAPDLASGDPERAVVAPPPVLHLPCHGEPPISRATAHHGWWQFHRPSRVLHVTASPRSCERRPRTGGGSSTTRLASSMSRRAPDLASNGPSWAVAVPPPVSHPLHHSEPPILRAATQNRQW